MTNETTREQAVEAAKRLADICKTECDHTVCVLCRYALQPTPPRDDAFDAEAFVRKVFDAGYDSARFPILRETGYNDRINKFTAELSARWPGAGH